MIQQFKEKRHILLQRFINRAFHDIEYLDNPQKNVSLQNIEIKSLNCSIFFLEESVFLAYDKTLKDLRHICKSIEMDYEGFFYSYEMLLNYIQRFNERQEKI